MKTRSDTPSLLYFTADHCPKDAARRYRQRVGRKCVVKVDKQHPQYLVAGMEEEDGRKRNRIEGTRRKAMPILL